LKRGKNEWEINCNELDCKEKKNILKENDKESSEDLNFINDVISKMNNKENADKEDYTRIDDLYKLILEFCEVFEKSDPEIELVDFIINKYE
jgi:hypothetical protein